MKRLVVCCDGTWQNLSRPYPTNVVKLAQIIKPVTQDAIPQVVYYQAGLGTRDKFDELTGGAFGWGIDDNIQDGYRFLCLNYEPGDEIYLFGFSRGAYTARSLAGLIYCSGLLERQHIRKLPQAYQLYRDRAVKPGAAAAEQFRNDYARDVLITLLGCWDTVGQLGVPNRIPLLSKLVNAKYRFYDTRVNRWVKTALHAVAIDERRTVFDVTPMQISDEEASTKLRQVWFPGTHGCVGGGTQKTSGLSDAALQWMLDEMNKLGLGLEFVDQPQTVAEGGINPDYTTSFDDQESIFTLIGTQERNILLNSSLSQNNHTDFDQHFFDYNIHLSAKQRWKLRQEPLYRPKNLVQHKQWFDAFNDAPT